MKIAEKLKICLIQSHLFWQDTQANLAHFEEKIWQIGQAVDLIILPEMFNSGFSMNAPQISEPMNLTSFKWMKQMAAQTNAVVVGSLTIKENGRFFNRLIWMQPDGNYDFYDKRHLFRMAGEDQIFTAGNKKIIKSLNGWRICPLICYDLRFPIWSRNIDNQYDCLLYVANFPKARIEAWDTLLKARAIENLAYCIGVNRIGDDGNQIAYNGHSAVYDFKGNTLFFAQDFACVQVVELSMHALVEFREKFPADRDADRFMINL